jgi:hypothetical protein
MLFEEIAKTYNKILSMQLMFKSIPIALTDNEKFAIAVMSGVRAHVELKADGSSFLTTEICGVGWTGESFVVMTKR